MNIFYALLFDVAVLCLMAAGLATIIGWQTARTTMLSFAARAVGLSLAVMFGIPFARAVLSDAADRVPIFEPQVTVLEPTVTVPVPPWWVIGIIGIGHVGLLILLWRRRRAADADRRAAWTEFERSRNRERSRAFPDDFGSS